MYIIIYTVQGMRIPTLNNHWSLLFVRHIDTLFASATIAAVQFCLFAWTAYCLASCEALAGFY